MYDIIPPCQRMYVIRDTDQLVTNSLGAVKIRLGGGWNPTTRTLSSHNVITYPVIEQRDACCSADRYKIKIKR